MSVKDKIVSFLKCNWKHIAALLAVVIYCIGQYIYIAVSAIGDKERGMDATQIMTIIVVTLISILLIVVYCLIFIVKNVKIEYLFLVIASFMMVIFLLIMPEYETPDETGHLGTAYDVSNHLMGYGHSETNHLLMRKCDADTVDNIYSTLYTRDSYNAYIGQLVHPDKVNNEMVEPSQSTVFDTYHYQYILPALWITFARLIHMPSVWMLLIGAMVNSIIYIVCSFYAIKKIPYNKATLVCVTLFPMVLQQVTSYSYDVYILSLAYVLIALTFKFITDGVLSKSEIVILCVTALLFAPLKSFAYAPMLLLIIIPLIKWRKKYKKLLIAVSSVIGVAVVAMVVYIIVSYSAGSSTETGEAAKHMVSWADSEGYTLGYILQHKSLALKVISNTFLYKTDMYINTLLGNTLGWFTIGMPTFIVYTLGLMAVFASLRKENEEMMIDGWSKLGVMIVSLMVICCVIGGMWIAWTPITYTSVEGVQGRYFLPIVLVLMMVFRTKYMSAKPFMDKVAIMISVYMQPLVILHILKMLA